MNASDAAFCPALSGCIPRPPDVKEVNDWRDSAFSGRQVLFHLRPATPLIALPSGPALRRSLFDDGDPLGRFHLKPVAGFSVYD